MGLTSKKLFYIFFSFKIKKINHLKKKNKTNNNKYIYKTSAGITACCLVEIFVFGIIIFMSTWAC
jgi:hypothetical protein